MASLSVASGGNFSATSKRISFALITAINFHFNRRIATVFRPKKIFPPPANSITTSIMLEKLRAQATRHPHLTLALITLVALLPFLAKPFNIDDPLFLWAAKQIHAHPGDPYGFNVEWGYREFPMSRVTEN